MLSWIDYDVKQEQYKDMQRAAMQRALLQAAYPQQPQRRMWQARLLRQLGRMMVAWGGRLEARYSS